MEAAAPKYPRVSKKVQRVLEGILTVIWLVGVALMVEVWETGWREPVILLVVVVLLETVFVVWNEGHLDKAAKAG